MPYSFPVQTVPPAPEQHYYDAYGETRGLFSCRAKRVLVEGPAGTGKTRAVLEKVYIAVSKYPGSRALIIRQTRESMTESVLVTFEDKVLPADDPLKNGPQRNNRQRYDLPNGSEIVVGGLDKVSKIMSAEYDMIAVFEATECTEGDVEKLTTRLRNGKMPYQQIILDYNPGAPTHWINQWGNQGKATRIYSRHEDNPTVTAEYLDTLRALTGARRARLYEGRWAAQEGLVYPFDPAIHVVTDTQLAAWGITFADDGSVAGLAYTVAGVDWGYTNPGVLGVWGVDTDGRLILLREWYQTGKTIDWWLDTFKTAWELYEIRDWVPDPAEPAYIKALKNLVGSGAVFPALNDIPPGIQAVTQRLALAGDGRPRLYVRADALVQPRDPALVEKKRPIGLREEMDAYVWPKGKVGQEAKEVPVKDFDHSQDQTRYVVMHQDTGRSREVLSW